MFCTNCGNEIKNGNKFCTNCGKEVRNFDITENINDNNVSSNSRNKEKLELSTKEKVFKAFGLIFIIGFAIYLLFKQNVISF